MANNNYAGFNYGGTQYNTGQVTYPAVTNATYANAAAYQNAAVAAGQGGGGAGMQRLALVLRAMAAMVTIETPCSRTTQPRHFISKRRPATTRPPRRQQLQQ